MEFAPTKATEKSKAFSKLIPSSRYLIVGSILKHRCRKTTKRVSMVIHELEISKNQIKKAGKVLKSNAVSLEASVEAMNLLSDWRARHAYPLNQAYKLVNRIAKEIDKKAIFGQRLKRAKSIINKLQRMNSGLNEMQDIAGCR